MAKQSPYEINLTGIEDAMKVVGFAEALPLLDKRIVDAVKQQDATIKRFIKSMRAKYSDKKWGLAPASAQNLPKKGTKSILSNPASPQNQSKNLTLDYVQPANELRKMMHKGHWFEDVCIDKNKYSVDWVDGFINALMASEHRDVIAKGWVSRRTDKIKGMVLGLLVDNHVFKKGNKYRTIASYVTGYHYYKENLSLKTDTNTIARYMGDEEFKKSFAPWVKQYIENQ